ncbi:MAG: methyltransferase domain-containing protein [candidate division SR1 bacterium]|nr:methyltransferase domain-containing protein [candidate division SR1 bacterium]
MSTAKESNFEYKSNNKYHYNGITIFAEKGVHEKTFEEFIQLHKPKDTKILILGAGAGSFDQRLINNGFTNITSVDLIKKFYIAKNKNIIEKNLNEDFDDLGEYDIIFAVEIIEHLENQFHFIRNTNKCLKKGGILFLSTPNTEAPFSRLSFLLKGTLNSFSENSLESLGHITPIFRYILEYNIKKNHLTLSKTIGIGKISINTKSILAFIGSIIYKTLSLFIKGGNTIIKLYIINK